MTTEYPHTKTKMTKGVLGCRGQGAWVCFVLRSSEFALKKGARAGRGVAPTYVDCAK
jgi:hypothetical protein